MRHTQPSKFPTSTVVKGHGDLDIFSEKATSENNTTGEILINKISHRSHQNDAES